MSAEIENSITEALQNLLKTAKAQADHAAELQSQIDILTMRVALLEQVEVERIWVSNNTNARN